VEPINATLAIIDEYKGLTSVFCANCNNPNFCKDCMPTKKRNAFEAIEKVLVDQRDNLP